MKTAPPLDAVVLFADEFDLNFHPSITPCWMKVGKQREVNTPRQNRKEYILGAVNYFTGEVFHSFSPRKDNVAFARLIEDVLKAYSSSDIYLIVDNFIIHRVGKAKDMVEKESRLKEVFLPTYSPHLNPIERLWRFLKRGMTSNYLFPSMEHLKEAVTKFFSWLKRCPQIVLSLIKERANG